MAIVIGTAGHIDHGKTSLVRALTGQDTDRLKEEKERGISIDLGFAYLDLPDGTRAGVIDVPGHERFIRNMLAGAHGIDLALFAVAADDGVMPQTREHLDIVHLLRIPRAMFVVTKVDLVMPSRTREIEGEIRALVAGTAFERAPIIGCSLVSGEGLDEIRAQIARIAEGGGRRRPRGCFRMPVDRVFVLRGQGVVVTGTAIGGEVKVGDHVRCLPGQHAFRVRSLHVHNQPVEAATEGQRVAINLAGAEQSALVRGDVIVEDWLTLTSDRFDAWLELRPSAVPGLKNHQRIRVHLGTAERIGSVRLLGPSDRLGPGQSAYCQIVVTEPLAAMRSDQFVIRDETAQRTLGGGVVVHPRPRRYRQAEPRLMSKLEALHRGSTSAVLEAFLGDAAEFAVPARILWQFLNVRGGDVAAQGDATEALVGIDIDGQWLYTTVEKMRHVETSLLQALHDFHAAHPLAVGMDLETAREQVSTRPTGPGGRQAWLRMSVRLFRAVVERFAARGLVVREASLLRLPQHVVRLDDSDRVLIERLQGVLRAELLTPSSVGEMEKQLGVSRARIAAVIRVMERERLVVRVAIDMYFVPEAIDRALCVMRERWSDGSAIAPGAFREAIGTTRKYAIPLLEYFDRTGVTVRTGDTRRLKSTDPIRA